MAHWFSREIIDTGRLPMFCCFLAMILAFGVARSVTRMIRAGTRRGPHDVSVGGIHVHHVIFGVILLIGAGLAGLALPDAARAGLAVCGALFGVGVALVLDEFALILHLRDVYWTREGRASVDAVFVAVAVTGLLLLGLHPLGIDTALSGGTGNRPSLAGYLSAAVGVLFNLALATVTVLKGKLWTGLIGLFIPLLLLFGAVRLARPSSPWARWRYRPGSRRWDRALKRERRMRAPIERAKIRVQDAIAGRVDTR
ncbi:MAG TPA: hypothetical protein VF054_18775 [Micromonosporaceae bacterium]